MRYQLDGLDIELLNGFEVVRSRYGEGIRFRDLEGLGKAVAVALLYAERRLTRAEFRFLRRFCDFSQSDIAQPLDLGDRTVSNWERGQSALPVHADIIIRMLAASCIGIPDFSIEEAMPRVMRDISNDVTSMRFAFYGDWQNVESTISVRHFSVANQVMYFAEGLEQQGLVSAFDRTETLAPGHRVALRATGDALYETCTAG